MVLLSGGCAMRMPNVNTRYCTIDDFVTFLYQTKIPHPTAICVSIQLTVNSNSAKARA